MFLGFVQKGVFGNKDSSERGGVWGDSDLWFLKIWRSKECSRNDEYLNALAVSFFELLWSFWGRFALSAFPTNGY